MAIVCSHCGKALPGENARFCTNCGKPVSSHPSSAQSVSRAKDSSVTSSKRGKTALKEQVAWPSPITHISMNRAATRQQGVSEGAAQEQDSVQADREHAVQRQFDVPISEQETKALEAEVVPFQAVGEPVPSTEEEAVDELPTLVELPATPAKEEAVDELPTLVELPATPAKEEVVDELPTLVELPTAEAPEEQGEAVDELPTLLDLPVTPAGQAPAVADEEQDEQIDQRETVLLTVPDHVNSAKTLEQRDGVEQDDRQNVAPFAAARPIQRHEATAPYAALTASSSLSRQRKLPIVVIAVLLVLLLGGGVITWIVTYQPFSVATVTNPQQSFSDARLGLSLLYPTGWDKQVDYAKSTAHFYANSNSRTIQVDIIVSDPQTGDLTKYLQRQASTLGMTGAKPGAALSFAGVSWQQLQGTVQRKGANFTCVILAASHGNHLYTMIQWATPDTYTDAERYFFSPMHNSLHFS